MSDIIKGFRGKDGPIRLDYSGVANVPGAIQSIGALTAQPGDHFEVETVDSTGRVATVKTVEKPGGGSGQNVAQVEPAYGDRPLVFFGTPLQQTKDEVISEFWYYSKTLRLHGWAKIKGQGNSTMMWPKKNQSVKLYKDPACTEKMKVNFKGWGKQHKFVIKAYWRDLTHTRDIVSVRLESECAKSRDGYSAMPELLRTSPNMGAVDGFPVVVYANGIYQGRYMWNIPKDAWMANMDDELDTHCILCSEDYNSSCFRAAAKIDGTDWTDEIHDVVPESIKTRWNEVISFVQNATDEQFEANMDSHIDVDSLIDRDLMGLYSCDFDGYGKNQVYMTYDGQKWYAVPYDKDGTWGVYWSGNSMLPSTYGRNQYEDMISGRPGNLLFIRMQQIFWKRYQDRWAILGATTLSVANTVAKMRELSDITPPYVVAEDYASTTANGAFTSMPNKTTCTIQQMQQFAAERHEWMDAYVAGLAPEVKVPCTGITLSASALTFASADAQTLTATVVPENTTDTLVWESSDTVIATVEDGVVTPMSNGNCEITARCGSVSAVCAVTITGIIKRFSVANNLRGCTTSNPSASVDEGAQYHAAITADAGYTMQSVTVLMGGVDITADVYSDGIINIAQVTGNISITAIAEKPSIWGTTTLRVSDLATWGKPSNTAVGTGYTLYEAAFDASALPAATNLFTITGVSDAGFTIEEGSANRATATNAIATYGFGYTWFIQVRVQTSELTEDSAAAFAEYIKAKNIDVEFAYVKDEFTATITEFESGVYDNTTGAEADNKNEKRTTELVQLPNDATTLYLFEQPPNGTTRMLAWFWDADGNYLEMRMTGTIGKNDVSIPAGAAKFGSRVNAKSTALCWSAE